MNSLDKDTVYTNRLLQLIEGFYNDVRLRIQLRYNLALIIITVVAAIWGFGGIVISSMLSQANYLIFIPHVIILGIVINVFVITIWREVTHAVYSEEHHSICSALGAELQLHRLAGLDFWGFKDGIKSIEDDLQILSKLGVTENMGIQQYRSLSCEKKIELYKQLKMPTKGIMKDINNLCVKYFLKISIICKWICVISFFEVLIISYFFLNFDLIKINEIQLSIFSPIAMGFYWVFSLIISLWFLGTISEWAIKKINKLIKNEDNSKEEIIEIMKKISKENNNWPCED